MEQCVRHFMDGGRYGLHLAHTAADNDLLIFQVKISVHLTVYIFNRNGNRRAAAQCFHKGLIIRYISGEVMRQPRKGLSFGLTDIKDRYRTIHGNLNRPFLHNDAPVSVQHRELRIRIELFLFGFLLKWRRRNNPDTAFTAEDVSVKLSFPPVETGDQRSVRLLHVNQHLIVDAVTMKSAHGIQVLRIAFRLEQILNTILNAGDDLLEPVLIILGFSHRCSFLKKRSTKLKPCARSSILFLRVGMFVPFWRYDSRRPRTLARRFPTRFGKRFSDGYADFGHDIALRIIAGSVFHIDFIRAFVAERIQFLREPAIKGVDAGRIIRVRKQNNGFAFRRAQLHLSASRSNSRE